MQGCISLPHADAEALHGDPRLDDPELRPVTYEPGGDWRELHESVSAACRQIVERLLDFVIGIDPYARGAMLRNQFVRDRLTGIAFLNTDHQAVEVADAMYVRMPADIDDKRLARDHVGRT